VLPFLSKGWWSWKTPFAPTLRSYQNYGRKAEGGRKAKEPAIKA